MISFQEELVRSVWDEAEPLMEANVRETGALPVTHMEPSRESYEAANENGMLSLFTMRDHDRLVGYGVFVVTPMPHYTGVLMAVADAVYVDPAYRGRASVRFLRWQDQALQERGVGVVCRHVTVKRDYSRFLAKEGYTELETSYMKRLSI